MRHTLLEDAIGSIQAGESQQKRLDEITERLQSDEFFTETADTIPTACIDGRIGGYPRPNTAGGTNSLAVSEDLTNNLTSGYLEIFLDVVRQLFAKNLPIGGHDDESATDQKCGCGACDRLPEIYDLIASRSDDVRRTVSALGVEVSDSLHEKIINNAAARHDFPIGPTLLGELQRGTIDHLRGAHKEVAAVINTKVGTTLDRNKLETEFGPEYEAFNIDVWSFEVAAQAISNTEADAQEKVVAMVYYNVATAQVLCGPQMRVIIR